MTKKMIDQIKKKKTRAMRSYTFDPEVVKAFEKKCKKEKVKFSNVLEYYMKQFIKK